MPSQLLLHSLAIGFIVAESKAFAFLLVNRWKFPDGCSRP